MSFKDWDSNDKIQFVGQRLLERGFKDWFLFFFKTIEKTNFVIEPIHEDLFNCFNDVYNLKTTRQVINIPPRAGKTTLAIYFIAYCFAKNPACQFIYTSYSQELLGDNSRRLGAILQSSIYQQMYLQNFEIEDKTEKTIDNFWEEYYRNENREFKITSRKITTNYGGCILFSSMGSQITGFGFSTRNNKGFSGCLIIDDGNKPNDIRSKRIRQKTADYYNDVLLTRANNSEAPIVNIQQRLHLEDLSGYLLREYDFNLLKKPLIENGNCLLPNQYSDKRIKELQKENNRWLAQYQQEPIAEGGNIIKTEWIKDFEILPKLKSCYIVGDTALKTKEVNDYSVFGLFGISTEGDYYLIDVLRGKWEAPELLKMVKAFWNKYIEKLKPNSLMIEDKASGTGLIQSLRRERIPIKELKPVKDKVQRLQDILPKIESGYFYIPRTCSWKLDFLAELQAFPDGEHDDQVDVVSYGLAVERITLKDIL